MWFIVEWSLSGINLHWLLPRDHQKGYWKNSNAGLRRRNNYLLYTNTIQVLNINLYFANSGYVLQTIFWKIIKRFLMLVLGSLHRQTLQWGQMKYIRAWDPMLWWWRHQMETFSVLLALCVENSPVTGEFPSQRPVTRGFDIFFDLRLNKRLSKQSLGWWFETPSCSFWYHCNVMSKPRT